MRLEDLVNDCEVLKGLLISVLCTALGVRARVYGELVERGVQDPQRVGEVDDSASGQLVEDGAQFRRTLDATERRIL
jgi:hypothetical protein